MGDKQRRKPREKPSPTPLHFFAAELFVLIPGFAVLGLLPAQHRIFAVVGLLVMLGALTAIVTWLAVWRPEALRGLRPLQGYQHRE